MKRGSLYLCKVWSNQSGETKEVILRYLGEGLYSWRTVDDNLDSVVVRAEWLVIEAIEKEYQC